MQTITFDGPRGLLFNYPPDVVAVVNGQSITRADVLRGKQERQARELARKRQSFEDVIEPAFVWVFNNGPIIPYGGTWLYLRTLRREWQIRGNRTRLQIMAAFPCGLLPTIENYELWKQAFISHYYRPNRRRPQGLALCRVRLGWNGQIIDILSFQRNRPDGRICSPLPLWERG